MSAFNDEHGRWRGPGYYRVAHGGSRVLDMRPSVIYWIDSTGERMWKLGSPAYPWVPMIVREAPNRRMDK